MAAYGWRVLTGPFAGMRYVRSAVGSALLPKLLGSYELELHPALEALVAGQPASVVNIGCGEGYYAVGLALRLPSVPVVAFDPISAARDLTSELACLNHVRAQVRIAGGCTVELLESVLHSATLIVCDCEGSEVDLLRPDRMPALAGSILLVETHDFLVSGASAELARRFSATHHVSTIGSEPRDGTLFDRLVARAAIERPELPHAGEVFTLDEKLAALSEGRPGEMCWLVMTPRAPAN